MTPERPALRRRPRGDRGVAGLELLGLLPVLALVGSLTLQAGAAMFTAVSASEAARTAARAASLGRDASAAARASLPGSLDADVDVAGNTVELTVKVPRVSPLPQLEVTRTAVMP